MVDIYTPLGDALTHGIFLSEVEDEIKASYAAYLTVHGREDLIDIPIGAE